MKPVLDQECSRGFETVAEWHHLLEREQCHTGGQDAGCKALSEASSTGNLITGGGHCPLLDELIIMCLMRQRLDFLPWSLRFCSAKRQRNATDYFCGLSAKSHQRGGIKSLPTYGDPMNESPPKHPTINSLAWVLHTEIIICIFSCLFMENIWMTMSCNTIPC